MRKLYRSLLAAGAVLGLAACGDDVSVTPPAENPAIQITGISVSPPSATITTGQTTQFSASVQTNGGEGTIDLTVTWSSSNTAVATVNASGQVTGVAAGNAVITARSNGNNAYSAGGAITVNAPAVTPNALLGFTVNPTAASVQAGSQVAVSTNYTASPGATVTFANSSNNTNCTVASTGANPTVTAVTVGTCVITITASGSGTGLVSNSLQASVAITITSLGQALQSLTVNPTSWNTVPGATQLVTTTTQAAAGATVTYANGTSNPAVATVTTTGANPTITAVGNGTAQITITASGSGANLQSNSLSATVTVNVQAASVSISSLTTCIDPDGPGPMVCAGSTPVNLAGVLGQIEATLNIASGNQQIASTAVYMGQPVGGSCTAAGVVWTEAARQIFGVNGAPTAPVTLSINTASFDANYVPQWLNGLECIQARLFPVSGPNPDASNTIQFTLVNPDVVYFDATVGTTGGAFGLNHTGNSATQATGAANTWWKGGFTFRPHPVLYSGAANVVSITYTSTTCGSVAATTAPWTATFSCAGVEAAQNISNAVAIAYVAGYTLTASPAAFMTAVTPGFVPGNPVYAAVTTREDNVGPRTHTPVYVNFGAGGWHGNGSAGTAMPTSSVGGYAVIPPTTYTVTATDFGVGGAVAGFGLSAAPNMTEMTVPVNHASTVSAANIPLAETLTPTPYFHRGNATNDILGNVGVSTTVIGSVVACAAGVPTGSTSVCPNSGNSAWGAADIVHGVDLVVLDAQYADRATSGAVGTGIWAGTTGQIYAANAVTGGVSPGTGATGLAVSDWDGAGPDGAAENIAIDAIDTRSGLDNPTALTQKIVRSNAAGNTNCLAFTTYSMATILADNYVQSTPQQFDCGLAAGGRVGEYTWEGYVKDRANNARFAKNDNGGAPLAGGGTVNILRMAIDEALPNITGIGFQTALYTGGQPATYSFSANDDLELWQGSVTLTYGGHAPINYPYGSSAYTTGAFGVPFDGTFTNVVNGAALTLGYYVNQFDFATVAAFVPGGAPSGNVAGFTSGGVNTAVTANVRDVAAQPAAVPLVAPVLLTQLSVRGAAPTYGATIIDFRITSKAAGIITTRTAMPSSVSLPYCDRIDIFEVVEAGGDAIIAGMLGSDPLIGDDAGDMLVYRTSIAVNQADPFTDNGFQRFYTRSTGTLTSVGTGFYVAGCVKSGSTLLSTTF